MILAEVMLIAQKALIAELRESVPSMNAGLMLIVKSLVEARYVTIINVTQQNAKVITIAR